MVVGECMNFRELREKIMKASRNLTNEKAAILDRITTEMLKYGGETKIK